MKILLIALLLNAVCGTKLRLLQSILLNHDMEQVIFLKYDDKHTFIIVCFFFKLIYENLYTFFTVKLTKIFIFEITKAVLKSLILPKT